MTEKEMLDTLRGNGLAMTISSDGSYIFNDGGKFGTIKNYKNYLTNEEHYQVMFNKLTREQVVEAFGKKQNPSSIHRLEAENATLRQQLADVTESMGRVEERCAKLREERDTYRDLVGYMVHPDIPDQLKTENAKLWELVRDYAKAANYLCERLDEYSWDSCATCALDDSLGKCVLMRIGDKAKELGIEVSA